MTDSIVDFVTLRARERVGQVLRSKWRLDRLIGVGGMASVYAATHRNGKRGAVKMLHLALGTDPEVKSRFLLEGYLANKVDHPGAVSVLDDDVTDDGAVFLVMELLEGETIDARVEARPKGRLETGEVLAIVDGLLDVLAAAHDKGIVHRDLKPDNVFLTWQGQVKVLDFGIARLRGEPSSKTATMTGMAMGTPAYMPPEQAHGDWAAVDARTDLWAVGATMFRLLTGRVVHDADSIQRLMLAAMTQPPPPLASVMHVPDKALAAIVDKALAFDRADRWPDARAMQRAVRHARQRDPYVLSSAPALSVPTVVSGDSSSRSGNAPDGAVATGERTAVPVSGDRESSVHGAARGWALGAALVAAMLGVTLGWLGLRRGQPSGVDVAAPATPAAAISPATGGEPLPSAIAPARPVIEATSLASASTAAPEPIIPAKPSVTTSHSRPGSRPTGAAAGTSKNAMPPPAPASATVPLSSPSQSPSPSTPSPSTASPPTTRGFDGRF